VSRRRRLLRIAVLLPLVATLLLLVARAGRAAQRAEASFRDPLPVVQQDLCAALLPLATSQLRVDSVQSGRIRRLASGVDVLALGESSHGTREFFAFKAEVIRTLVEQAGVRTLAFESPWRGAKTVDRYIAMGEGDLEAALEGLAFWTWRTPEVAELLDWLRAFNAERPLGDRVRFFGIDPQMSAGEVDLGYPLTSRAVAARDSLVRSQARSLRSSWAWLGRIRRDRYMADNLLWVVEHRRDRVPVVVWAHDGHVARTWGYMGYHVASAVGRRYRNIALVAGEGRFTWLAAGTDGRFALTSTELEPAGATSLEGLFSNCSLDGALLLVDSAQVRSAVLHDALGRRLRMRSIGGARLPAGAGQQAYPTRVAGRYDAIWFTRTSTPTEPIAGRGVPSRR